MATPRRKPAGEPERVVRIRDAAWVTSQLDARTEAGGALQARTAEIRNEEGLKALRREFSTWSDFNRSLLEACFSGPILKQYDRGVGVGVWGGPWILSDEVEKLHDDVGYYVRKLESIRERFHLFDVSTAVTNAAPVETDYDAELWAHVRATVEAGDWPQSASLAATFFEDRLRTWAELPNTVTGPDLATKAMKPVEGPLRLGDSEAEEHGWHQMARGFFAAVRNVDNHRIQRRDDARLYALGVLGTASLLLTQLRYQYPKDTRR